MSETLLVEYLHAELRNMSAAQADIAKNVVAINTKMDGLIDTRDDHEVRIRAVEKMVWRAGVLGTILGSVGGALLPLLIHKLFGG